MGKYAAISPNDNWQAEDDLNTMLRSKEIQGDPKRMAAMKKCACDRLSKDKARMDMMKQMAQQK